MPQTAVDLYPHWFRLLMLRMSKSNLDVLSNKFNSALNNYQIMNHSGIEVKEALRAQMEMQRRLYEQVEVK